MKCYNCQSELIWGGDHDCDRSEEHLIETNLSCPKCNALCWFCGERERRKMTPEQLNAWRIIPRILMFAMIGMTYRTVEWFMSLPDPNPEQAALVSVMTGALTGAFGLFLGKKE